MRRLIFRVRLKFDLSAFLSLMLSFTAACVQTSQPSTQSSDPTPTATQEGHTETVPAKLKTASQDKNLSLYDFGGRFSCTTPFIRNSQACEVSVQTARNFIRKHWQEKSRGYIVVKRASVDSASNAHIFIEPDDRGAWRIVWRWELIYAASSPNANPGEISQLTEIRSIERKLASETSDLRPGTSYVVFLDEAGEQVEWL
jgi:hypothetical protein